MNVEIALYFGIVVILVVLFANQVQRQTTRVLRIESMVKALLENAGIDFNPDEVIKQKIVETLGSGNKIQAIKQHREFTGSSLKDAKEFVEKLQDSADGKT
ncbi:MAG: hypothetical protein CMJ65_11215 [Planctomycetaceae bacterium]|jgi:ribosomal protein L7/L12|nr:hypothetical protein [Planctomycetaceae bacterium]MDP7277608.1 ribosomal protein L7/L12 [Planctomycetaceae bacterium]